MERWSRVPTSILKRNDLTPADKITFVALCTFADKNGECFPKRSTLAEYTSMSVRSISTCIRNLTKAGVIEQIQRKGSTPLYIIYSLVNIARDKNTVENFATVDMSLCEKVRALFHDVFPSHGYGNIDYVNRYIKERARTYQWYSDLFEVASRRPFLCGENDRNLKMPLSFILREGEDILYKGKYAPWTETAQNIAAYLKEGGTIA